MVWVLWTWSTSLSPKVVVKDEQKAVETCDRYAQTVMEPATYSVFAVEFYHTTHGECVHTRPDCRGLRNRSTGLTALRPCKLCCAAG